MGKKLRWRACAGLLLWCAGRSSLLQDMPPRSPVGIPNRVWKWRGGEVRYQVLGEENQGPSVLLIHGLLVNADHWRQNLPALAASKLRVYALDLLGSGYTAAKGLKVANGEQGRDLKDAEVQLVLGPGERKTVQVPQAHPLGSAYNIFTWSEEVGDFIREVIGSETLLIGNSLGSLVSLQAALDQPALVKGLLLVNPRFRQEHVAEAPALSRPVLAFVQSMLRETPLGRWLFELLSTEEAVTEILKEPYFNTSQVTSELVEVLRAPLLREGALESTLDILSYSTGPLLEQLLEDPGLLAPVWVCWGAEDPWTPLARVRALAELAAVRRLVEFPEVGHCPHDEAPQVVNELILEFAEKLWSKEN